MRQMLDEETRLSNMFSPYQTLLAFKTIHIIFLCFDGVGNDENLVNFTAIAMVT